MTAYAFSALYNYANSRKLVTEMQNNSVSFKELQVIFNNISELVYDSHVYEGGYCYNSFKNDKVWGIVTNTPKATIEIAAQHGIMGAEYTKLGYDYIVYWPEYEYNPD